MPRDPVCRMQVTEKTGATDRAAQSSNSVRDPVCGMTVDPHATPNRRLHAGRDRSGKISDQVGSEAAAAGA